MTAGRKTDWHTCDQCGRQFSSGSGTVVIEHLDYEREVMEHQERATRVVVCSVECAADYLIAERERRHQDSIALHTRLGLLGYLEYM